MSKRKREITDGTIHEQIDAVDKLGFHQLAKLAGFGHAVLSLVQSADVLPKKRVRTRAVKPSEPPPTPAEPTDGDQGGFGL